MNTVSTSSPFDTNCVSVAKSVSDFTSDQQWAFITVNGKLPTDGESIHLTVHVADATLQDAQLCLDTLKNRRVNQEVDLAIKRNAEKKEILFGAVTAGAVLVSVGGSAAYFGSTYFLQTHAEKQPNPNLKKFDKYPAGFCASAGLITFVAGALVLWHAIKDFRSNQRELTTLKQQRHDYYSQALQAVNVRLESFKPSA